MSEAKHPPRPLTKTMLRELQHIDRYGTFRELDDYSTGPLAFYAREKVLTALIARGLIADAETITDAGRAALDTNTTGRTTS